MGFSTENRTVLSLFQKSSVYIVPRYQRAYVWRELNWSELLTDINFTVIIKDINWSHFLGTIVLNNVDKQLGLKKDPGITYYEIIDGQQRITTLFILFNAISRHLIELETTEADQRALYIQDTYISTMKSNSEKIPKIDNEDIKNDLMEIIDYSKFLDSEKIPQKNEMLKVFKYYLNFLSQKNFEDTDLFLNKLLEINIVEIVSEQEEEIYNIFEVLNARGQKLKQMELLKNHIMKYVRPREDAYIDHVKKQWNEISKRAATLSDVDNLIVHFAKCYIRKKAENKNSVYKLIKEEVPIDELNTLLKDLDEFSEAYIQVNESETQDPSIEYFNIKRNQQIRALLSAVLVLERNGIIMEEERKKVFLSLRNFFFIFNGMQKTSNKTEKIFGQYSYSIYNCKRNAEFKMHMSDLFLKLGKFIDKSEFINNMKNHPSFRYSNKDKTLDRNGKLVKYTLVEYCRAFQNDTKISLKDMTIEHLKNDGEQSRNTYIGNLTITNQLTNGSKLKNNIIKEKLKILEEESSIIANKKLKSYYNEANDFFDIDKRGEELISTLYEKIFDFRPDIFNLKDKEVEDYFSLLEIVANDEDLLNLLKNHGKNFINKLEKDPSLLEQNKRLNTLLTKK